MAKRKKGLGLPPLSSQSKVQQRTQRGKRKAAGRVEEVQAAARGLSMSDNLVEEAGQAGSQPCASHVHMSSVQAVYELCYKLCAHACLHACKLCCTLVQANFLPPPAGCSKNLWVSCQAAPALSHGPGQGMLQAEQGRGWVRCTPPRARRRLVRGEGPLWEGRLLLWHEQKMWHGG